MPAPRNDFLPVILFKSNFHFRPSASNTKKKKLATKANRSKGDQPTKSGKVMSGSIKELLEKAKAGRREKINLSTDEGPAMVKKSMTTIDKPTASQSDDDDGSSSSGDEYLVPAKELDLGSTFFETKTAPDRVTTPNFDCNVGLAGLSDSEPEDDLEEVDEDEDAKDKSHEKSTDIMQNLKNFTQNIEDARENLKRHEEKTKTLQPTLDVTSLLALGEAKEDEPVQKKPAPIKKRRAKDDDSGGSDWEEVEGKKRKRLKH